MGDLSNEFEKLDLSGYFRMAHCHGGEIKRGADGKQLITGEWKKTQKLLNALENVIIPQYQQRIKFILATLEERDREEFARLKKVKAAIEKRK